MSREMHNKEVLDYVGNIYGTIIFVYMPAVIMLDFYLGDEYRNEVDPGTTIFNVSLLLISASAAYVMLNDVRKLKADNIRITQNDINTAKLHALTLLFSSILLAGIIGIKMFTRSNLNLFTFSIIIAFSALLTKAITLLNSTKNVPSPTHSSVPAQVRNAIPLIAKTPSQIIFILQPIVMAILFPTDNNYKWTPMIVRVMSSLDYIVAADFKLSVIRLDLPNLPKHIFHTLGVLSSSANIALIVKVLPDIINSQRNSSENNPVFIHLLVGVLAAHLTNLVVHAGVLLPTAADKLLKYSDKLLDGTPPAPRLVLAAKKMT